MQRAITYFAIVFGVGFILGGVRVVLLVPRIGERYAELLEMPFMLLVIVFSARFVTRRFPAACSRELLISGVIALAVLLAVEFSLVLGLRGLTLEQYLSERDPVAGLVYLMMLAVFAAMPWLVGSRRGQNIPADTLQ